MNIQLSKDVVEKLAPYTKDGVLLLDLDDGVGSFSKFGVCSLDTSFRFLVVKKDSDLKDYQVALDSKVGPIYIKDYTLHYFGKEPKIDLNPRFLNYVLSTEAGIVDNNVQVIDMKALQELSE